MDNMKQVDLVALAEKFGYRLDRAKSTKTVKVIRDGHGDKLLVKMDGEYPVFCSCRDDRDRGSVIDFVMKRLNLGYVDAVNYLGGGNGGTNRPPSPYRQFKSVEAPALSGEALRKKIAAVWNASVWNPNHTYLLSRGLVPETLNDSRFMDTFRKDKKGNAVFLHVDREGLCGYELRNTGFKSFCEGGRKGIWRSNNIKTADEVVVCEAVIDCLSHAQLYGGDSAYVATGGALSGLQRDLMASLFAKAQSRGVRVVIATDNDDTGEKFYQQFQSSASGRLDRETPISKDWNQDLMEFSRY